MAQFYTYVADEDKEETDKLLHEDIGEEMEDETSN